MEVNQNAENVAEKIKDTENIMGKKNKVSGMESDAIKKKLEEIVGEVDQLTDYGELLDQLEETMRIEGPEKDMMKLLVGMIACLILTVICCFGKWGFLALIPLVILAFMGISKAITVHDQKCLHEGKSLSAFVTCAAVGVVIALIMAVISGFSHISAFFWIAVLAAGIPGLLAYLRIVLYHHVLDKACEVKTGKRHSVLRMDGNADQKYQVEWDDGEGQKEKI